MTDMSAPVLPGETIGILGGGQLGRMSAMAAARMGYRTAVLTPEPGAPCIGVTHEAFVAPYDDPDALQAFSAKARVITYEFENVPAAVVAALESTGCVRPSSEALRICQHRWREKTLLQSLDVPTAAFAPVYSLTDLREGAERLGFPLVLKTTQGGYDGKGQTVIKDPESLEAAFTALGGPQIAVGDRDEPPLILEAYVRFERELSVIVARNPRGEITSFPVAENVHRNNILHRTIAPARITAQQAAAAQRMAETIAQGLGIVGLLAVEMFATGEDLLVNELAPRPHNSGHYTLDACITSQFEQHVRAVCGLPLGSTRLLQPAVMINVLGQHMPKLLANFARVLEIPTVKVHLYGKGEARYQRKMGHLTAIGDTVDEALDAAARAWSVIEA